jgi:predicted RecA/RadA family phage recombinase
VAVGDVVVLADTVAVAHRPIAAGVLGSVAVEGVFNFPKGAGAISQGANIYWDTATSLVSTSSGAGKVLAGKAAAAAASADTVVAVDLG